VAEELSCDRGQRASERLVGLRVEVDAVDVARHGVLSSIDGSAAALLGHGTKVRRELA
jgi:hypothetical protein